MGGELCLQKHLFEHFYSEGNNRFFNDVTVTLTDKFDGKNPIKREYYWQHTLNMLAPHDLNIEDDF